MLHVYSRTSHAYGYTTDHVRRVSFNFNPYKKNLHDSNSLMFKLIQTQFKHFTLISSILFLSNHTIMYHDAMLILDFSISYNLDFLFITLVSIISIFSIKFVYLLCFAILLYSSRLRWSVSIQFKHSLENFIKKKKENKKKSSLKLLYFV